MAGTIAGGLKAAATNKERYGEEFYIKNGKIGGLKSRGGGFAHSDIGSDGLTGPKRAQIAGSKGGKISKRTKG